MTQEEMILEIHRLRSRVKHLTAALEDFENHGLRSDLMPTQPSGGAWRYDEWVRYLQAIDASVRNRATMYLGPVRKFSSGTMPAIKENNK
jgi:hypothetical protein